MIQPLRTDELLLIEETRQLMSCVITQKPKKPRPELSYVRPPYTGAKVDQKN